MAGEDVGDVLAEAEEGREMAGRAYGVDVSELLGYGEDDVVRQGAEVGLRLEVERHGRRVEGH